MLYVIFNSDGSIKYLRVGESIQQGDHLSKQLFAAIEGVRNTDYVCSASFVLPNGEINELVSTEDVQEVYTATENIFNGNYDGYSVKFTEAQTYLAGNLKVNLKLINLQGVILCTYQVTLKINPTGYSPNDTFITESQYNSLLQSLNTRYPINMDFVKFTADQGLSDSQKANARNNIGAGTSSFSGSYNDLTNKPQIPTKTSDIQNDGDGTSPFATQSYVTSAVTGATTFKGTVPSVGDLPSSGNTQGDMYWVTSENSYYIWNGTAWSEAGGSIDLSNYPTISEMNTAIAAAQPYTIEKTDLAQFTSQQILDLINNKAIVKYDENIYVPSFESTDNLELRSLTTGGQKRILIGKAAGAWSSRIEWDNSLYLVKEYTLSDNVSSVWFDTLGSANTTNRMCYFRIKDTNNTANNGEYLITISGSAPNYKWVITDLERGNTYSGSGAQTFGNIFSSTYRIINSHELPGYVFVENENVSDLATTFAGKFIVFKYFSNDKLYSFTANSTDFFITDLTNGDVYSGTIASAILRDIIGNLDYLQNEPYKWITFHGGYTLTSGDVDKLATGKFAINQPYGNTNTRKYYLVDISASELKFVSCQGNYIHNISIDRTNVTWSYSSYSASIPSPSGVSDGKAITADGLNNAVWGYPFSRGTIVNTVPTGDYALNKLSDIAGKIGYDKLGFFKYNNQYYLARISSPAPWVFEFYNLTTRDIYSGNSGSTDQHLPQLLTDTYKQTSVALKTDVTVTDVKVNGKSALDGTVAKINIPFKTTSITTSTTIQDFYNFAGNDVAAIGVYRVSDQNYYYLIKIRYSSPYYYVKAVFCMDQLRAWDFTTTDGTLPLLGRLDTGTRSKNAFPLYYVADSITLSDLYSKFGSATYILHIDGYASGFYLCSITTQGSSVYGLYLRRINSITEYYSGSQLSANLSLRNFIGGGGIPVNYLVQVSGSYLHTLTIHYTENNADKTFVIHVISNSGDSFTSSTSALDVHFYYSQLAMGYNIKMENSGITYEVMDDTDSVYYGGEPYTRGYGSRNRFMCSKYMDIHSTNPGGYKRIRTFDADSIDLTTGKANAKTPTNLIDITSISDSVTLI